MKVEYKPVVVNGEIEIYDMFVEDEWLGSRRLLEDCKRYVDFWINYEAIQEQKESDRQKRKENNQKEKNVRVAEKLKSAGDDEELKTIILDFLKDKDRSNPKISDWMVGQVMKNHKGKFDPTVIKHLTMKICDFSLKI